MKIYNKIIAYMLVVAMVMCSITVYNSEEVEAAPASLTLTPCTVTPNGAADIWEQRGGYECYVGEWNGSTAQMGVDPANPDHVQIQQLSSSWYDGWGLQLRKTVTGLTANATYTYTVDMYSSLNDGKYITSSSDVQVEVGTGTKQVVITGTADGTGTAKFTIGLGWVGTAVVLDFSNPTVTDANGNVVYPAGGEAPTTAAGVPAAPAGFVANINDLNTNYTLAWQGMTGVGSYNLYINGTKYNATIGGSANYYILDFATAGLVGGQTYTIELAAVNANGEGPKSPVTVTVPAGAGTVTPGFTSGDELLNRTDFGDGSLTTDIRDGVIYGLDGLWIEYSESGAIFANNGDGSVSITVPAYNGTENNYDTQFKQHEVALVAGKWYRVRYTINSDVDKTIQFLLQENGEVSAGNWNVYQSQDTIVKAGVTEYVEFVFQAQTTTSHALYGLMMGPINGPCGAANVTISDVSLIGYDTQEEATYPRRVIDIMSNATDNGTIDLYWNVAGGNTNIPAGQVYDIIVDGATVATNVAYTAHQLTEMSSGPHTITIISKLGSKTTEGYTVTVSVPEPALEKLGTIVNQVTELDKLSSIGAGWTYNFPVDGSDNYLGVDEYNSLVVYSPTANDKDEFIYKSVTDLTVGKYYTYYYTIVGDKEGITIPTFESNEAGYTNAYNLEVGTAVKTITNDMRAADDSITIRYNVKGLADAAVKISSIVAREIQPVAAANFTATGDVENIKLSWNQAAGASAYQTYSISYTKDGGAPVGVATGLASTVTSYDIEGLEEGKYVMTITSSINGRETSVSSTTVTIGAAVKSNDITVEGFQIKTNDTSASVAYRSICKVPNVGSTITDEDGNVYTVAEFGTIYTKDSNWSGFNTDNTLSAVHTVLGTRTDVADGIDYYSGANCDDTRGFVSTSNGILAGWNNDDTANTYYVQTMTGMDPDMAYTLHVRAFVVATDGTIIYGDSTAVTSVAQIADYFYKNSLAKNYTAHSYLYTAILNSKYLTAAGLGATGATNNRYYRTAPSEYGWNGNLYNPSVIPLASAWKYHMSTSNSMDRKWNTVEFDDSSWKTGFAPFGDFEIGNIKYNTLWEDSYIWMRRTFELKDATDYANHSIVLNAWNQQGTSAVDLDFENENVGAGVPAGITADKVDGGSTTAIVEENGNKFLRLTTDSDGGHANMSLPYDRQFTANANQRIVVEYSARFNEALQYANACLAKDENDNVAVSMAFENASKQHKVILKKNGGSVTDKIADFSYDTWHDYKVVINMVDQTYTVYMDGKVISENYPFRANSVTSLWGHAFGIDGQKNGQLDFDNFKVSVVDVVDMPKIYLNGQLIYEIAGKSEEYVTVDLGTEFSKYLVDGTNVVAIQSSNFSGGTILDCGMTLVKNN